VTGVPDEALVIKARQKVDDCGDGDRKFFLSIIPKFPFKSFSSFRLDPCPWPNTPTSTNADKITSGD
jgi:hypothetical protein